MSLLDNLFGGVKSLGQGASKSLEELFGSPQASSGLTDVIKPGIVKTAENAYGALKSFGNIAERSNQAIDTMNTNVNKKLYGVNDQQAGQITKGQKGLSDMVMSTIGPTGSVNAGKKLISSNAVKNLAEVEKDFVYKTFQKFELSDLKLPEAENKILSKIQDKMVNGTATAKEYLKAYNFLDNRNVLGPIKSQPLKSSLKSGGESNSFLQKNIPGVEIKNGGIYPNDFNAKFKEGGSLHYQEMPNEIIIRAVGNGGNNSGVPTKAVRSLIEYAKSSGKDVRVTGIHNYSYWSHLGFPPTKDFESILKFNK